MNTMLNDLIEMLEDDIVSHGLFAQYLKQENSDEHPIEELIGDALKQLLLSERVEIGIARMKTPDYLEFVAWNGKVDEKVSRALAAVATANGPDKEFAYWLCLKENIDHYEGQC